MLASLNLSPILEKTYKPLDYGISSDSLHFKGQTQIWSSSVHFPLTSDDLSSKNSSSLIVAGHVKRQLPVAILCPWVAAPLQKDLGHFLGRIRS